MDKEEYIRGNWAIELVQPPGESKFFTVIGIHSWAGDYPEIKAIDRNAAIRIVDCLDENTIEEKKG